MAARGIEGRFFLSRPGFTLDVCLSLPGNGVTVLFGPSGSGKTTLLRAIAGLEKVPGGELTVNGEPWQQGETCLPVHRRPLGYVFQEASLFDHLSAGDNLRFAIKRSKRGEPGLSLDRCIDLLGIGHLLDRYPARLSGGERQRVAIARALLVRPRLLLLDEPLASLDHRRKQEILPYLERLKAELGLPILYVTHSPDEVARLADYLVALDNGAVVAAGPLAETLNSLDFPIHLGEEAGAVVNGTVAERDPDWQLARVSFPGGSLWIRDTGHGLGESLRMRVLARDISLSLVHAAGSSIINAMQVDVLETAPDDHPGLALVKLRLSEATGELSGESTLIARVTRRSAHQLGLAPGKRVWAQIKSVAIVE